MTDEERGERFNAALAKYLGVDPLQIDGGFYINSDDPEYAVITWDGYCLVSMEDLTRLAEESR